MRVLVGSAWVGAVLCVHTTSVGLRAWSIAEGFPLKTDVVGVRPQPQRVLNLVGIGSGLRPDDLGLVDGDDDVCGHIKPRWVFEASDRRRRLVDHVLEMGMIDANDLPE